MSRYQVQQSFILVLKPAGLFLCDCKVVSRQSFRLSLGGGFAILSARPDINSEMSKYGSV